ncbi:hypothetical protein SISSUDRAFT_1038735, partial [Sistotremastrum suecicum HHB10207 ss-3]
MSSSKSKVETGKKREKPRKVCYCVTAGCVNVETADGRRGCEMSVEQWETHQAADAVAHDRLEVIKQKAEDTFQNDLDRVEQDIASLVLMESSSLPSIDSLWGRDSTSSDYPRVGVKRRERRDALDFQAKSLCLLHADIKRFHTSSQSSINEFLNNSLHFLSPSFEFPLLHIETEFARLHSLLSAITFDDPSIKVMKDLATNDLTPVAGLIAHARIKWQSALDQVVRPEPPMLSAALRPSPPLFDCYPILVLTVFMIM